MIPDLYAETFDVAVFGAGYCGLATAMQLAARGERVLLAESNGQLLWESSSALEETLPEVCPGEEWQAWQQELESKKALGHGCFDPLSAEMLAAQKLSSNPAKLQTLFYAVPVAAQQADGKLAAVIFATKEGFRRVRARRWVDASETGILLRLLEPKAGNGHAPDSALCRMALQSYQWEEWGDVFEKYAHARGMQWRRGARVSERQLVWQDDGSSWHVGLVKRARELRSAFDEKHRPLISHSSAVAFPIYGEGQATELPKGLADNLLLLSPAHSGLALGNVAERFAWGCQQVREVYPSLPACTAEDLPEFSPESISVRQEHSCEVLVAGAGTAGALAAMSAGTHGARTCALEFAPFPGGIGTGGGITSYFYGLPGGRQEDLGQSTDELTRIFDGSGHEPERNYWHHDAKKIAILQEFDRLGVGFFGRALLCGVEKDGSSVTAVLAAIDGELVRFTGRAFIDSTGDGDLCAFAGADYATGRSGDSRTLAYSQAASTLQKTQHGLSIHLRNFDAGWLDATSAKDLSRARLSGIVQYDKNDWTDETRPLFFAPLLGVRESRHIVTDYTLQMDDLITRREFEDCIGRAGSHADTPLG